MERICYLIDLAVQDEGQDKESDDKKLSELSKPKKAITYFKMYSDDPRASWSWEDDPYNPLF
ncbi:MAG: hypothetical protein MUF45_11510 [Spirosomaceae bacterium]|jgi:hypothetical protein|nr:hypothetical protein [Spirosomataceae bacterium]